jgi:hypothetical protein
MITSKMFFGQTSVQFKLKNTKDIAAEREVKNQNQNQGTCMIKYNIITLTVLNIAVGQNIL